MHAPHTLIDGEQDIERPHCNPGCGHHKGDIGNNFDCVACKNRLEEDDWTVIDRSAIFRTNACYLLDLNLHKEQVTDCGHTMAGV